jgi:hypothetical protein
MRMYVPGDIIEQIVVHLDAPISRNRLLHAFQDAPVGADALIKAMRG